MCVSVPSGVYSGSPVELEPCNSSNDHQLWAYLDGTFEYTPDPGWSLDVHYASTAQDTPVDVAVCNLTNATCRYLAF